MPGVFKSLISRTDASPLIPTDQAAEIIQALPQQSVALSLFRQVNMGTKITTLPVLDSLGQAYRVNGDTGLKQTTDVSWVGVDLIAEEIAAIVPIPDAVSADMSVSPWEAVRPLLVARIGAAIDAAVFAGTNKPATWPTALIPAATAAGNLVVADSSAAEGGIATDIGAAFGIVETDGYDVSGVAAARTLRGMLRAARDTTGQKLLDISAGTIEGVPIAWVPAGAFGASDLAVVGDYSMAVLGIRQDITFKVLDQAVLTDDLGNVIINLPQQDSSALRVVMRVAFAAANPITPEQSDDLQRFPFAVLTKPVGP